ncbi:hypothetical protein NMY22_g12638 [Coprinellus aureogranulatus]|nr:hypothetical protein NMY22_g12638 [Coprinellus aureogranulatus]
MSLSSSGRKSAKKVIKTSPVVISSDDEEAPPSKLTSKRLRSTTPSADHHRRDSRSPRPKRRRHNKMRSPTPGDYPPTMISRASWTCSSDTIAHRRFDGEDRRSTAEDMKLFLDDEAEVDSDHGQFVLPGNRRQTRADSFDYADSFINDSTDPDVEGGSDSDVSMHSAYSRRARQRKSSHNPYREPSRRRRRSPSPSTRRRRSPSPRAERRRRSPAAVADRRRHAPLSTSTRRRRSPSPVRSRRRRSPHIVTGSRRRSSSPVKVNRRQAQVDDSKASKHLGSPFKSATKGRCPENILSSKPTPFSGLRPPSPQVKIEKDADKPLVSMTNFPDRTSRVPEPLPSSTDGNSDAKMRPRPRPVPVKPRSSSKALDSDEKKLPSAEVVAGPPVSGEANTKGKGKGRAVDDDLPTPPDPSDQPAVDDDRLVAPLAIYLSPILSRTPSSSDLHPEEREQLRRAIEESKLFSSPRGPGESSKAGSTSSLPPPPSPPLPADVSSPSPPRNMAYMEDLTTHRRCLSLPDTCEVWDPELMDPVLKDQYPLCPKLRRGILIPWMDAPGKGFMQFSKWATWCPDMNGSLAFDAINFVKSGPFGNPSRMSPLDTLLRAVPQTNNRYNFYCATDPPAPLVATSCIFTDASQLVTPSTVGLVQKYLRGRFHGYEWDRFCGFVRTGSGFTSLHAQLAKDELQFSTRAKPPVKAKEEEDDSPDVKGKRPVPGDLFKTPSKRTNAYSRAASDNISLPHDAIVPVYDARRLDTIDFNSVLPRLADTLPIYTGGEIPYGSFIQIFLSSLPSSAFHSWRFMVQTVADLTSARSVHLTAYTYTSANVAAFIARSTTTLGIAFQKCFDLERPPLVFGGGSPRKRALTADELRSCVDSTGAVPALTHPEYTLVDFIPLHMYNPRSERHRDALVLKVPYRAIIPMVGVNELRDLCKVHKIPTTSSLLRPSLVNLLENHSCSAHEKEDPDTICEESYAVLRPRVEPTAKAYAGLLDVEAPAFAATIKTLSLDDVRYLLTEDQATLTSVGFEVTSVKRSGTVLLDGSDFVLRDIPHAVLAKRMNIQGIRSLASHHGVSICARWKKESCMRALTDHRCDRCTSLYYVLRPICPAHKPVKHRKAQTSWIDDHDPDAPFPWEASYTLPAERYPPRPTSVHDMAIAMKGYCDGLTPEAIEEDGCCVCGQLCRRSSMSTFNAASYDLTLLEEIRCTRLERLTSADPIQQVAGPIIDGDLTSICPTCDEALSRGQRPKASLANHLWLGKVPECLKNLTLAEKALITRVRYNRCIVRVAKGHAKMVANVIAFEHPTKKIHERLPISRDELSEVLSVLYNGAEPPSDEDLRRTPVLVRRDKVRNALEWLKINHRDYADLSIDYTLLDEQYPLDGVPVGVLHRTVEEGEGNVPASAKSVFDTDVNVGTTEGPCPFSVNGLTAERFGTMTPTERKLVAMRYLKNGGSSLAVGHDPVAQPIFNNPRLYPQMFPWLFPYGYGGLDQDEHLGCLSRENHLKWWLMYHDKRFQEDAGFLIVAFNHQLIRQSSKGSYITMKRGNFGKVAEAIEKLDPGVLQTISERLADGGRFYPQTPEEQRCQRLLDQVETVGSHVDGSLAKKKYQRSEIWSMINFLNSPAWFITFSPADSKHPLCIYLASHDVEFKPKLRPYSERLNLISRNPVACARFFDYLVNLFLKHICGWSDEDPRRGIFGTPSAYYGTVEQQGRMTLHLHFLLWIRGQLSLNEIRDKIMADDSEFIHDLTEYIESCMIGEFMTGSKDEVGARVPYVPDNEDRGIHTILTDTSNVPDGYADPTQTLPEAPPPKFCQNPEECLCDDCQDLLSWWERTKLAVDDILFRSNIHTCFGRKDNKKATSKSKAHADTTRYIPKAHATGKGCINKDGICTARFPRPIFWETKVDTKNGHIDPKKREAQLNDVNPVIAGCTRCNTDLRCLLSGTSVKAIVGYVTYYISKGWLKTHQVFSTMYDAFKRNESVLNETEEQKAGTGARRMIVKVVNSLSSKMEIGAPMAALYLLQNPDHYTSHQFVPFYWKNYSNYVQSQWAGLLNNADTDDLDDPNETDDVGVVRVQSDLGAEGMQDLRSGVMREFGLDILQESVKQEHIDVNNHDETALILNLECPQDAIPGTEVKIEDNHNLGSTLDSGCPGSTTGPDYTLVPTHEHVTDPNEESVRITRSRGYYFAKSNTDDYRCRPPQLEKISLYEFVQCSVKHPIRSTRRPRQDLRWFRFSEDHPQFETHAVALDPDRRSSVIPNFLGPSLPRRDVGDREEYCSVMLTLFCPWRTGIDLKSADDTWEAAFNRYPFTDRENDLMCNFNMRYECYDARDDYSAILRAAGSGADDDTDSEEDDEVWAGNGENDEDIDDEGNNTLGDAAHSQRLQNLRLMASLRAAGWKAVSTAKSAANRLSLPTVTIDSSLRSIAWNNIVRIEKLRAWKRKLGTLTKADQEESKLQPDSCATQVRNDAFVVPGSYLSKEFKPANIEWSRVMDNTVEKWSLNEGQEKAFRIVANHGCCVVPEQLLMHLGGMGGTGKSTVIKALCDFFTRRSEQYRFVLLGPTGTSAALIGGSTYHSFLGLNTGRANRGESAARVEEVRERLTGVGYLLIDEVSMLDCRALCAISARCCEALGVFEKPFGGLNVILCGDFAQLPPVNGSSLYSRKVALKQSARQTIAAQENTIGKLIWLQFTTVVILTQNMRQVDDQPEEVAFRKALGNLRWNNCSDEDIQLLRSRIAGTDNGLTVDAEHFRDVSIITSRNMDKDHINVANSVRFSAEHDQEIHDFYSIDTMSNSEPKRTDPKRRKRVYCTSKTITKSMQTALWSQSPCTSEQIPGKLSICRGMPVIIRGSSGGMDQRARASPQGVDKQGQADAPAPEPSTLAPINGDTSVKGDILMNGDPHEEHAASDDLAPLEAMDSGLDGEYDSEEDDDDMEEVA